MVQLSYRPIKTELYRVQCFVNYIMLEVILKAHKSSKKQFSANMVIPRYRTLIEGVNKEYLLNPLKVMFKGCKTLNPYQLKVLRRAVYSNNRIEDLCEGKVRPVHYSELEAVLGADNKEVVSAIKNFCYELYDHCLKRKPFIDEYENIRDYYKKLVARNSNCIMCGFPDVIDTELDDTMSAFDHYLPRALYPFNSVNMKNLVPTCDKCNEKYKKAKDPLFEKTQQLYKRKNQLTCFYPFSGVSYLIVVGVHFSSPYNKEIPKEDIEITLSCDGQQEKVDNWERVYGIKNRYRAWVGNDNAYNFYLCVRRDALERKLSFDRMIQLRETNIEGDMNFLKVPFLKAILNSQNNKI